MNVNTVGRDWLLKQIEALPETPPVKKGKDTMTEICNQHTCMWAKGLTCGRTGDPLPVGRACTLNDPRPKQTKVKAEPTHPKQPAEGTERCSDCVYCYSPFGQADEMQTGYCRYLPKSHKDFNFPVKRSGYCALNVKEA